MQTSRVLVVEDEFLLAREMAIALEAGGFEIAGVAPSTGAALRLARSERVDIAILDLDIRGTALREVLALLAAQGVRLVYITSDSRSDLPGLAPPSLQFEKPVPASFIVAALRHDLDGAGAQPLRPPAVPSAPSPPDQPPGIRVAIAMRDALLREGLARILKEDDFSVSIEGRGPQAILDRPGPLPDILLCDGADLSPRLLDAALPLRRRSRLPAFVFLLSGPPGSDLLQLGDRLGTWTWLAKDISPARLKQALRRFAGSEGAPAILPRRPRPAEPRLAPRPGDQRPGDQRLADDRAGELRPGDGRRHEALPAEPWRRLPPAKAQPHLSDRERQIAAGLVCGYSNKHIANRLKISEGTVKTHMKAILKKTRARNRTQGALWAIAHGITGEEFERPG